MKKLLNNFPLVLMDYLVLVLSFHFLIWFRFSSSYYNFDPSKVNDYQSVLPAVYLAAMVIIIPFALSGFYRKWHKVSRIDQWFSIVKVVSVLIIALFIVINLDGSYRISMSLGELFGVLKNISFAPYIALWAFVILALNLNRIFGIKL